VKPARHAISSRGEQPLWGIFLRNFSGWAGYTLLETPEWLFRATGKMSCGQILKARTTYEHEDWILSLTRSDPGNRCCPGVGASQRTARSSNRTLLWRQRPCEQESCVRHRLVWCPEGRFGRGETNWQTDPVCYCSGTVQQCSRHVVTGQAKHGQEFPVRSRADQGLA